MLDPKELRIGNLLQLDGAIFRVTEIAWNGFKTELLPGQNVYYPTESTVRRIEITEEILLRAGFDKTGSGSLYLKIDEYGGEFEFRISVGELVIWVPDGCTEGHNLKIKIQGFHHLQNIVFDLTGKELTL